MDLPPHPGANRGQAACKTHPIHHGTATHVTAVFGMIAAGRVLEKLAE
jgi:tRNA A37 threonylcarbamoyladenosine dehydratase